MTGYWLKVIAMVTMLIDHGTAILVPGNSSFYIIGRSIGRLAFPIFCFLLVEGFLHTSNVKKYLLRLGIFALISEIPFDLAFNHTLFELGHQNIFFTLLIGLLVLIGVRYVDEKHKGKGSYVFLNAGIIIGGCLLALILATDYYFAGVLMILSFYQFRHNKVLLTAALVIIYNFALGGIQILAVFAMIPILFYNGQRGTKINKYVFYSFYPVHILTLYLIGTFLLR